jgi:TRAP-type C4-dicarboxylate transport system permease large subunit
VIIVGGILTGAFTPTEAAVAACAWALFLGLIVYRTLTCRFLRVSFDTIETTAVVLFVVGAAAIFAWVLTSQPRPRTVRGRLLPSPTGPG